MNHALSRARFGLLLLALPALAYSETSDLGAPTDLAQWGLHCFCITARHTPHGVVQADNNGQILWHVQGGVTRAGLAADNIPVTSTQILLLKTYGLVQQNGDKISTTFPIVGPGIILPLRERLRALSADLAPRIAPDAAAIGARLKQSGYPGHAYAVVFGYALDGLLWDELRKRDALPDTALDLDHPIWKGAFWAIYPEKRDTAGTNEDVSGGKVLVSVWTEHTSGPLRSIVQRIAADADPHQQGIASIPRINNLAGDAVHDGAQRMAAAAAAALLESPQGRAILESIPQASTQQAVVIVAHEFIWAVMERLISNKTIGMPDAMIAPQPSDLQLQQLLFWRDPQ